MKLSLKIGSLLFFFIPARATNQPDAAIIQLFTDSPLRARALYSTQGLGFTNPTLLSTTWFALSDDDSNLTAITTDRTKVSRIRLISDTGTIIGGINNLRGWNINKNESSAELSFSYQNSDIAGQSAIAEYTVVQFDGVNNQLQLPTAGTKIVFAADTNLYRSTADTLKTDDNLIIAGNVTINTLNSPGVVHTNSSGTLSTSSIINSDVANSAAITYTKLNLSGSIVNTDISTAAAIAYAKLNLTNSVVNADIATTAAIARSKIATGTANQVIINDGTGTLSSEANLAVSRGGTGLGTLTSGQLLVGAGTSAVTFQQFTNANTASAIVQRDPSGNFSAGTVTASVTGAASLNVLKAGDTMTGTLIIPAGSAAVPSLKFAGSTDTGISAATANTLSFDTNGVEQMNISTTAINTSAALITKNLICNQAIQVTAPTTNNVTVTTLSTTSILLFANTASRTGITVDFPPNPINGQLFTIMLGSAADTVTLINTGGTGGATIVNGITALNATMNPTATSNGNSVTYIYIATSGVTTNAWYRLGRG